jgi:hypothetical protein
MRDHLTMFPRRSCSVIQEGLIIHYNRRHDFPPS